MAGETDADINAWQTAPERAQLTHARTLLKTDPAAAFVELQLLANSDSRIARYLAMTNLGVGYGTGAVLGRPDLVAAEEWFRRAAKEGYRAAEFELGILLRKNGQYDRALDTFTRAAAIGYAPSMRAVGTMYARGEGVTRDLEEARRWWERAMSHGNVLAKHHLAVTM